MDLTEAEYIKKSFQEYTELYKKYLHDPDNHDGVITPLEPDILECKVRWALGSITMNKPSEGDGIPIQLFEILKDNAVKVLHPICQQILENAAVATGLEKVSFHSNPKYQILWCNTKECSNYRTIALLAQASKYCSKFSKLSYNST